MRSDCSHKLRLAVELGKSGNPAGYSDFNRHEGHQEAVAL